MENNENELRQAIVTCNCGCGVMIVTKYNWSDGSLDYGILFHKQEFYNEQQTIFRLIRKRIKNAWYTLIGKEYLMFDLAIDKKDFELFKKNINEI